MGKLFNPDTPIMQALSKIADWVVLNFFVVICSLPIITLGASVTALYDAMDRLQKDEGRIYWAFFRAFGSNFKQATLQWLLLLVSGVLLLLCLYFYLNATWALGRALLLVTVVLLLLWCSVLSWVFPLQAKFYNSVKNTLRNALLCAMAYLPRTIVMIILNMAPWALALLYPTVFLQASVIFLGIWFSMVANINLRLLKKPFQRMIDQIEPPTTEETE